MSGAAEHPGVFERYPVIAQVYSSPRARNRERAIVQYGNAGWYVLQKTRCTLSGSSHADIPSIDVIIMPEQDDRVNPLGVKGIGEIGIVGMNPPWRMLFSMPPESACASCLSEPKNFFSRVERFVSARRLPTAALPSTGAVDIARGEARIARRQLHINRGQFGGLSGTAQNGRVPEMFVFLHRRTAADLQRGPNRTRCDAIHANAPATQLFSE